MSASSDPQPSKKRAPTILWIAIAGGGCLMLVACTGILAAIAIPAFVSYTQKAKSAEARANLGELSYAVESHCRLTGRLPDQAGPVPPRPSDRKQIGDFSADPVFAELGFAPADPVYYSYGIRPGLAGHVTLYAHGDLDGDGIVGAQTWTCGVADCTCAADHVDPSQLTE